MLGVVGSVCSLKLISHGLLHEQALYQVMTCASGAEMPAIWGYG